MAYVDYQYYCDSQSFCGSTIEQDTFSYWERKAENYIKSLTFGNINNDNIPECVKNCCCEVAELYYKEDKEIKSLPSGIKQEKTGEHTVTFEDVNSITDRYRKRRDICIREYLLSEGLMYRGI